MKYMMLKNKRLFHLNHSAVFLELLFFSMALFSFTTLTYHLWPIINRIVGIFIIIDLIIIYLINFKIKDVLVFLLIGVVVLFSCVRCIDLIPNLEDAIYWSVTMLIVWKMADSSFGNAFCQIANKYRKVCWSIVAINTIMVGVSLFLKSSYQYTWEGNYFLGFSYSQHSLCCGICITMSLSLITFGKGTSDLIKLVIFVILSVGIIQSGARTYLLSLLVLWFSLYFYSLTNTLFKVVFLPLALVVAFYFFINSNMMEKMLYTLNNIYTSYDKVESFTSGRSAFWLIDLQAYAEGDLFAKLFGSGFDYVYFVNLTRYDLSVWAHNDFINTLLCNGIFGLFVYSFVFFCFLKKFRRNLVLLLLVFLYSVGISIINGLFAYQHYLYSIVFFDAFAIHLANKKAKKNAYVSNSIERNNSLYVTKVL